MAIIILRYYFCFKVITKSGRERVDLSHLQIFLFNSLTAKLFNWNFHPLEVVSR